MFVDSKSHNNLIPHSKELHDMLLEGYHHAIVYEEDKVSDDSEGDKDSKSGGGYSKFQKKPHLSAAELTYELSRDGMIIRIDGYKNRETARMAYEEIKQMFDKKQHEKEEQEYRVRLVDIKKHLGPEFNYD